MNKTVTVNIGGLVFHIEEQAYDRLRKYLEAIRGYFTTSDGRDEIIQDIESRIAEIFTDRIGSSRQVVTDADVEFMINAMGRPEQVAGEDNDEKSNASGKTSFEEERTYRKLYRDPDDKVIGGVCSGISHYVGIDPIWLRLAFAAALFLWGTGPILYIVLLIIIPKAKTTAEKLEMKGRPVNIESIKKTIEEEVEDIKNRFHNPEKKRIASTATGKVSRFFEVIGEILLAGLKAIAKIIGFFFMFIAACMLIALFVAALGMTGVIGNVDIPVYITKMFLSPVQLNLAIVAMILTFGIPLLLLLYRIAKSLFKIERDSRTLNMVSGALWSVGLLITIYLGVTIGKDFKEKEQQRIPLPIAQPASDTLHLETFHPNGRRTDDYYDEKLTFGDDISLSANGDSILVSRVKLDIIASDDSSFSLIKIVRANGRDRREANNNLQAITYDIAQDNSTLRFSEHFMLDKAQRYRNQQIQLVLKVPVGKSVFLSHDMENIIYDVQNVTNTYDGDMGGLTWTMTAKGLECLNCDDLPENTARKRNQVKVRVNGENVDVESLDDSIDWDSKDVHINIDDHGVVIDAKEKDNTSGNKKSW